MKFIDLKRFCFVLEPRYYFFGWSKSPRILARPSTVEALVEARSLLPRGYNFKIWDCQRSRKVQIAMLDSFRRRFKFLYPKLKGKELEKMLYTFGARPVLRVTRLDTHRNGGSVDLTIVDQNEEELYMGTDHDDLTERAATDYFEKKKSKRAIDREAQKNRRLLILVMSKVGFKNYAPEWWHWSLDR